MPVVEFHMVTSCYSDEALTSLLEEASLFYAAVLYPEMERPPIERVRAIVHDVAPRHWATGGKLVRDGGAPAPYFTCLSLKGRRPEQLQHLMSGMTDMLCRHLGCAIDMVRGQVIEIDPEHWYIAGAPASQARSSEIAARASR